MEMSWREYQYYMYLILAALFLILFVISFNDLVIHYSGISNVVSLSSLGNWLYWIIAISFSLTLVFFYYLYRYTNDSKKFYNLINGSSKQTFVKNFKDLEIISSRLGPSYVKELEKAKNKWNMR